MSLVAGMSAGADSIDDTDVLRHGAMARAFSGIRAPSRLGTFQVCRAGKQGAEYGYTKVRGSHFQIVTTSPHCLRR